MKRHEGCRISGRPFGTAGEIPLLLSFPHLPGEAGRRAPGGLSLLVSSGAGASPGRDPLRGQWQVGSLTGAVHLSNCNAGVLRRARGGQKPPVEQKGKSSLDLDFQYEYGP
ncbi:hypothetical protein DKP78_13780 [Enterococcus faecium]|nr:hypothetical protein DKP78_13780 [Enterococcus faecium]